MEASLPIESVFVGRYRIESVITQGKRKWTYLASDMKARGHRQVALAVLEPGSDPTSSPKFRVLRLAAAGMGWGLPAGHARVLSTSG
jgi:hypothetical protein